MPSATLTSKGQITVPVEVRKKLGLRTGDRLDFVAQADGSIRISAKRVPFEALRGILRSPYDRPVTLKEMDEGIAQAVRERFERATGSKSE